MTQNINADESAKLELSVLCTRYGISFIDITSRRADKTTSMARRVIARYLRGEGYTARNIAYAMDKDTSTVHRMLLSDEERTASNAKKLNARKELKNDTQKD